MALTTDGTTAQDVRVGWLNDLLLESPLPPGLWLPAPGRRRAQAHPLLERLRSGQPGPPSLPGYRTHDRHPLYPIELTSRYVPAAEVEADFADSLTHLNPPVIQGWAAILGAIALVMAILSLPGGIQPSTALTIIGLIVPPTLWVATVAAASRMQKTIELDTAGTVRVRRWTDAWLLRPGVVLGEAATLRMALGGHTLTLTSKGGATARIDLRPWPGSARATLADDLRGWGVGAQPMIRRRRRHHGGRSLPARRPAPQAAGDASDATSPDPPAGH